MSETLGAGTAESRAARSPHGQPLARDGAVVGLSHPGVPVEVIWAAGFAPLLITAPEDGPTPTADVYMDPVLGPQIPALFQRLVDGDYRDLALLTLTRRHEKLYYYLKEIVRIGEGGRVPPLHILDLMQSRRPAVRGYNRQQFDGFIQRIERLAGRAIHDDDLAVAIHATNAARGLQQVLAERRWAGAISGSAALQVLKLSHQLAPDAYRSRVEALLGEGDAPAHGPERTRVVLLSAVALTSGELHCALEAAGVNVATEDDVLGARAGGPTIPTDRPPRNALFEHYVSMCDFDSGYPWRGRTAWFEDAIARPEAEAAVIYLPPSDRHFGWDLPRLTKIAQAAGKPCLVLRTDVQGADGSAAVQAFAKTFVSAMSKERA